MVGLKGLCEGKGREKGEEGRRREKKGRRRRKGGEKKGRCLVVLKGLCVKGKEGGKTMYFLELKGQCV